MGIYKYINLYITVAKLDKPLAGIDALRDLKAELISRHEVSKHHRYIFWIVCMLIV